MDFVQILSNCSDDICYCSDDILTLLSIIKWGINLVCWITPIILIIVTTVDVAKVVTAGNLDEKMKKEVGNKLLTRIIYAIVIFLIPIIVNAIFSLLPDRVTNNTGAGNLSWYNCWKEA